MNETNVIISSEYSRTISEENTKKIKQTGYLIVKRFSDILISLIACIFLIPLIFMVKVLALLSGDTKTIFFKQKRIGKNGNPIYIYKFRSMVPNAQEMLKKLLKQEKYKEEWERNQKLSDDPRITKVGKFLRKTSLDEFPQFINVLKGDMSIIGPRPLVEGELDLHNGNHLLYESVKPGITGWWACNGRSSTTYEDRLNLEYYYIRNRSILLDLKCTLKTIIEVFIERTTK